MKVPSPNSLTDLLRTLFEDLKLFFTFGSLGQLLRKSEIKMMKRSHACDPHNVMSLFRALTDGKLQPKDALFFQERWKLLIPQTVKLLKRKSLGKVFSNLIQVEEVVADVDSKKVVGGNIPTVRRPRNLRDNPVEVSVFSR
jgi:hypothetical protein